MMKRFLGILVCAAVLVSCLAACKRETGSKDSTVPTSSQENTTMEQTTTGTTTTPTTLSLQSAGSFGVTKLGDKYALGGGKYTVTMPDWTLSVQEDHVTANALHPEDGDYDKFVLYKCKNKAITPDSLYAGIIEYVDPNNISGLDPKKLVDNNKMSEFISSTLEPFAIHQYGEKAYVGNVKIEPYARGEGGYIVEYTAIIRKTPEYDLLSDYLLGYMYAKGFMVVRRSENPFNIFVLDTTYGQQYEVLTGEIANMLYNTFTNKLPFDKHLRTTKAED